jgi:hypothetical protein
VVPAYLLHRRLHAIQRAQQLHRLLRQAIRAFVDRAEFPLGWSGNRTARYDPLHQLAGDLPDQLAEEVVRTSVLCERTLMM